MKYDVIVIGAGISGLSAASLLAKQGLKVAVLEHGDRPGGSCGIFKRKDAVFDQGASMLYGFGEHGFNAHRFLFNCLEEPFEAVKHDLLYVVHYNGKQIRFWPDVDRFIEELSAAFPGEGKNIRRFYKRMQKLYSHVISETPSYTTPDEVNPREALRSVLRHPLSYLKFLSYLDISAEKLLRSYFTDPELLHFFDKLTSTYCYATIAEAPAILASVMFIDNHEGGCCYPAGSTLFLPGKLEKVIEENGGEMRYQSTVTKLLFDRNTPNGVLLEDGTALYGTRIIYSGTVWNLYGKLLPEEQVTDREKLWAAGQAPTYPSVVLYALVDSSVIPEGTCPIEMLAANPQEIDESEVTVYILSIDDHTLCPADQHAVVAIGPSFRQWDRENRTRYEEQKQEETARLIGILNRRFPGFADELAYSELATPGTVERYTMKNGGAVAGPKQMLGQHLLKRQSIRTRWETLFCCGESTTMGTGTPTVTTSGIAAANAILKDCGGKPYYWEPDRKNYVRIIEPPIEENWMFDFYPSETAGIMKQAGKCRYCSEPACCPRKRLDVPGVMRRIACGNLAGARKVLGEADCRLTGEFLAECEKLCVQREEKGDPVRISEILKRLIPDSETAHEPQRK